MTRMTRIIRSIPDGDCFYHVIVNWYSIKHPKVQISVQQLKDKVADFIQDSDDLYKELLVEWRDFGVIDSNIQLSLDQVIDIIRNDNEWVVSTIIHIVSILLQKKIVIHQKIGEKVHSQEFPYPQELSPNKYQSFEPRGTIHVLQGNNHYDLLVGDDLFIDDDVLVGSTQKQIQPCKSESSITSNVSNVSLVFSGIAIVCLLFV